MTGTATMTGMSRRSGRAMGGDLHLKQSIGDILSTPIGTRVMRRDYGSVLFELIDQPLNARTRLRVFAAVAMALARWEPRLKITVIALLAVEAGSYLIDLTGVRTDTGAVTRLSLPIRPGLAPVFA